MEGIGLKSYKYESIQVNMSIKNVVKIMDVYVMNKTKSNGKRSQ